MKGLIKMENKYYLAVEITPKNYFPIHLLDLNITNYEPINLSEIDTLTLKYKKEEIFSLIKKENILEVNNNMSLVVIYYEKKEVRKIPSLTKDIDFDLWAYLKENYKNKQLLNKIDNFLKNKIDQESHNKIKNSQALDEWMRNINSLSYEIKRKLYFYLYENRLS